MQYRPIEQGGLLPLKCDVEGQAVSSVETGDEQSPSGPAAGPVSRYSSSARLWLPLLPVALLGGLALALMLKPSPSPSGARLAAVTAFNEEAAATTIELYSLLGEGRCLNQTGAHAYDSALHLNPDAEVLRDGSSPDCAKACSANASCTGYSTAGGKCRTIMDEDFLPAQADGSEAGKCFWRHKFVRNTTDAYPVDQKVEIPKILWSYWEVMPDSPAVLLDFVDLCGSTWKTRNPGWEVRVLNSTTVQDWLGHGDLPDGFDSMKMKVAHKADIIRLALLAKHGGVWLDASSLIMQPLDDILGSHQKRTFFNLPYPSVVPGLVDQRVDWKYHVENWFLAAPPKDPFVEAIIPCVWEFFEQPAEKRKSYSDTGLFTKSQVQMLKFLGITEYISTTACIFKAIDEDAAFASWYVGPQVQHVNPAAGVEPWVWNQPLLAKQVLFDRNNQTMVDTLMHDVPIFKFIHDMRSYWILPLTPKQLLCKKSTFHVVISELGYENKDFCDATQQD